MANEAGVKLTAAGATFPFGRDPRDRNIRIAPSLPPLEEIRQAMELLAICVQLAAIEKR
jgi:DNA-binding transcriptional MocR family regulator